MFNRRRILLSIVFVLLVGLGLFAWQYPRAESEVNLATATYVGRSSCVKCHPQEVSKFLTSHHHLAMGEISATIPTANSSPAESGKSDGEKQPGSPVSDNQHLQPNGSPTSKPSVDYSKLVLAPFQGESVKDANGSCVFLNRNGRLEAVWTEPNGSQTTAQLKYTFGINPLQQYLVDFPDGRKQVFPYAYDPKRGQWFWSTLEDKLVSSDPTHWTNRGANWNFMCAECHSTNLQKNFDPEKGTYNTTFSEIDVSCEACHGPASEHVQLMSQPRWNLLGSANGPTGLAKLKTPGNQIQLDTCGQCHTRRELVASGFKPGNNLLDHYHPELLDTAAYHPDGQIRDENYEYTSFHLSLMYHKNVRCSDCHDPHSAKLRATGNALCIRCHEAGKFDTPSHHFHKVGSTGAQCVECHMPETTYMKVDPRRDHSFRVPRPDLTKSLGVPNACNRCHQDKDADWSAKACEQWYGKKDRPRRINFAEIIAAARNGKEEVRTDLFRLAEDRNVPAYVRASAVALCRNYPGTISQELLQRSISDAEPIVRMKAARHLAELLGVPGTGQAEEARRQQADPTIVKLLTQALHDPIAGVRTEAGRALAFLPEELVSEKDEPARQSAIKQYLETQRLLSDDPAGSYNLAIYDLSKGQLASARTWLERALKRDPNYFPAQLQLGSIAYEQGNLQSAQSTFEDLIRRIDASLQLERTRPNSEDSSSIIRMLSSTASQAHFTLALLLNERASGPANQPAESNGATKQPAERPRANAEPSSVPADQLAKVVEHLEKAVGYDPGQHRMWYNLGVAYLQQRNLPKAASAFRRAGQLQPDVLEYLIQLASVDIDLREFEQAKRLIERIELLAPQAPALAQLKSKFNLAQRPE